MNGTRMLGLICLAAFGLAAGTPALAQMKKDAGWYIGAGVGSTKTDIDNAGINASLIGIGFASAATASDERDTGWKLFAGYQFNPNFAVELGYADLGRYSFSSTTVPAGALSGSVKIENNWSADLLGILPVGSGFSLFARAGVLYSEAKGSAAGSGAVAVVQPSFKDDDVNYKLGLGVGYDFANNVGLRGEWERYRVPDGLGGHGDVDLFSVSLRFRF